MNRMMNRLYAGGSCLVSAVLVAACAHVGGGHWETLVDGSRGLGNWMIVGDANWRAEDGAIVADKGTGGFLVTPRAYDDFELRAEFWAATDTNSGIYMRCAFWSVVTASHCYEANIWDIRPDPKYGTGAIVDVAAVPVPLVHKAGGRWNTMEITAVGPRLTVKLNGVVTADVQDRKHASGPVALQYGAGVANAQGGPIRWRKVQIRAL